MLGLRHNYLVWHRHDTREDSGSLEGKARLVVSCVLPTLPTHAQITKVFKKQKQKTLRPLLFFFIAQALALHSIVFTEQISQKLHGITFLNSSRSCCVSLYLTGQFTHDRLFENLLERRAAEGIRSPGQNCHHLLYSLRPSLEFWKEFKALLQGPANESAGNLQGWQTCLCLSVIHSLTPSFLPQTCVGHWAPTLSLALP